MLRVTDFGHSLFLYFVSIWFRCYDFFEGNVFKFYFMGKKFLLLKNDESAYK